MNNETMNYSNVDKVSSCFIELNKILERLQFSNYQLDKYEEQFSTYPYPKQFHSKEKPMIRILVECVMSNLYKFIEIHDHVLGKILRDLDSIDLEKSLEECIKPVINLDKEIRNYRHLVAHSKEQASKYVSFLDIDSNFYHNLLKMKLASRATVMYILCIFDNLPDIVSKAQSEHKFRVESAKKQKPSDIKLDVNHEIEQISMNINSKLKKNGYRIFNESLKRDYDT